MVGTGTAVSFKYCEYVVRELSATTHNTVFFAADARLQNLPASVGAGVTSTDAVA